MTFLSAEKSCPRCGTVFHPTHHAQKYCNPFCKPAKKGTSPQSVQAETKQSKDVVNTSGQEKMYQA
jgi:hypothetical protein